MNKTGGDWLLKKGSICKGPAGKMAANAAMLKVFERSGMTIEGQRPGHYVLNGEDIDPVLAGRLRPETSWMES